MDVKEVSTTAQGADASSMPDSVKASPLDGGSDSRDDSSPTGFLDLSAELRNRIYEDVLVTSDLVNIATFRKKKSVSESNAIALLQVDREIRNEASAIYYGQNTFIQSVLDMPRRRFDVRNDEMAYFNADATEMWLKGLGEKQARLIKKLVLSATGADSQAMRYIIGRHYEEAAIIQYGERLLRKDRLLSLLHLDCLGINVDSIRVEHASYTCYQITSMRLLRAYERNMYFSKRQDLIQRGVIIELVDQKLLRLEGGYMSVN